MTRTVGIGYQDFEQMIAEGNFYIDKTMFIRQWWESKDRVTLINRPRRFGKTLAMSMVEKFFSVEYADRGELFEGLDIWEEEKYRNLQGTYPVIFLSFANIKENTFVEARKSICRAIEEQYNKNDYLLEGSLLNEKEKRFYQEVSTDMSDSTASAALRSLSDFLGRYYGRKTIILLDEYDTPMQEAYVNGYWEELVNFTRSFFNAAFKTNPYLERAIMTGITRISRESMFSDLNNLKVVTTTSEEYADCFGFTEEEVFGALDEFGLADKQEEVKMWYDGFVFGSCPDIYNPWSIINYLDRGKAGAYWANTSSNSLVGKLLREGNGGMKQKFETLLSGGSIHAEIDEQIVYNQLGDDEQAVWSFLLAGGYLKVRQLETRKYDYGVWVQDYELELTNFEVRMMFRSMVKRWFAGHLEEGSTFLRALLDNDLEAMNEYMSDITCELFSSFDTGKNPSGKAQPERFYHGFVLGLMVELQGRYVISSNRESGYGRYDIMLEPRESGADAYIIEFKVARTAKGETLEQAVESALAQIEEKQYETELRRRGIPAGKIRKYGFAFEGKNVLIGGKERRQC